MKNSHQLHSFDSSKLLVDALCERICHDLKKAIELKNQAVLALSGGSTPKRLFKKLSKMDLPWSKVIVTLVDERWVKPGSPDSNERLLRETLLQERARYARFIPLKNAAVQNIDGELLTCNRFKDIEKLDVVVLGMGSDGHTASFFPRMPELKEALESSKKCCATTAPQEPLQRMSLSRSFLLTAETLILHIEGKMKKSVFDSALESSDSTTMPIIAMMQQEKPLLEVYHAY